MATIILDWVSGCRAQNYNKWYFTPGSVGRSTIICLWVIGRRKILGSQHFDKGQLVDRISRQITRTLARCRWSNETFGWSFACTVVLDRWSIETFGRSSFFGAGLFITRHPPADRWPVRWCRVVDAPNLSVSHRFGEAAVIARNFGLVNSKYCGVE